MKKFLTLLITALIGSTLVLTPVYAEGSTNLKEATFDVTEFLKLGDDKQKQGYFEESKQESETLVNSELSPIVRFILDIIEFGTKVIGTVAVLMFILAGLLFIVSEGNEQRISAAKDMFKYTIIGLLIAFMSYIIIIFVQSLFIQSETTKDAPAASITTMLS